MNTDWLGTPQLQNEIKEIIKGMIGEPMLAKSYIVICCANNAPASSSNPAKHRIAVCHKQSLDNLHILKHKINKVYNKMYVMEVVALETVALIG